MATAQHSPNTRRQFVQLKWLDEIVVGARIESTDALAQLVSRRKNQHRGGVVARANKGQKLQPIAARQSQVEQDGGVTMVHECKAGTRRVGKPIDAPLLLF